MNIHPSEFDKPLFSQVDDIFGQYLREQGRKIHLGGRYCQKHARELREKLELNASAAEYFYGKVHKLESASNDLMHRGGGIFSSHHLVIADIDGDKFVLDPYMKELSIHPILYDNYINRAFENAEDVVWVESNLESN